MKNRTESHPHNLIRREVNQFNNRMRNPASVSKAVKAYKGNKKVHSIQEPCKKSVMRALSNDAEESSAERLHYTGQFSIEFYPHKEWTHIAIPENVHIDSNNIMHLDNAQICEGQGIFQLYEANGDIFLSTGHNFVKAVKDAVGNTLWENRGEKKILQ